LDIKRVKLDIKMVQKRVQRLNKEGLRPDALEVLQSNLAVFYSGKNRKQPKNSTGISMQGLSTQELHQLHRIVMSFARNPLSTRKGIQDEFKKMLEKQKKINPNIPKIVKKHMGSSTVNMLDALQNYDKYVTGVIANNIVWSEQLRQVWYDGFQEGKISEEQADEIVNKIIDKTIRGDYDNRSPDKIRQLTLAMINRRYRRNKELGYVD
jgi:hypothetical protein